MELFSELYSCYYQVLRHLLCSQKVLTIQEIRQKIYRECFGESLLSIIPKLENGDWSLFHKKDNLYISKISSDFLVPLSLLEKSYLKALLLDPRICLFLEKCQQEYLQEMLSGVDPLWRPEQFFCFDQFADGDPYHDEVYRRNFSTLLQAQKKNQIVEIDYNSPKGNRVHHYYAPARLEYSPKNNRFRLLALKRIRNQNMRLEILNLSRMQRVRITDKTLPQEIDLNAFIRNSYYKEPIKLRIENKRNALERAMLHFANYEKNTTKIDDTLYECLIYYNQSMETELLIEVMSFGPTITVIGNEGFRNSLKERLKKQQTIGLLKPPS